MGCSSLERMVGVDCSGDPLYLYSNESPARKHCLPESDMSLAHSHHCEELSRHPYVARTFHAVFGVSCHYYAMETGLIGIGHESMFETSWDAP